MTAFHEHPKIKTVWNRHPEMRPLLLDVREMKQKTPQAIDWSLMISQLVSKHVNYNVIGFYCGTSKATVGNWRNNTKPDYEHGERLIQLWRLVTKEFYPPRVQNIYSDME